jgi:hypothetical protein
MITLYVVSGEGMSLIRHQFKEEKRENQDAWWHIDVGVWELNE